MFLGKTPRRRQWREPVTLPAATVDAILTVVVPLTNLTGARIAGADLIALSRPDCSVPALRQ